jgi:hypothetical protein
MIQPEGFDDGSGQVCLQKVPIWPQTIGKRMVLLTFKFPEIHWIRDLSKKPCLLVKN